MIKLPKVAPRKELVDNAERLTREFIESGKKKVVWRKPYIRDPLFKMSHRKCAYCEGRPEPESYVQVEHYKPKDIYPNDVVAWENLLPICQDCNTQKGTFDTGKHPIVNPRTDNPNDHLKLSTKLIAAKDDSEKGKQTIIALKCNEGKIPEYRYKLICKTLIDLEMMYSDFMNSNVLETNGENQQEKVGNLLKEANPKSDFSALMSTIILHSHRFKAIKQKMIEHNLWNKTLRELYKESEAIMFEQVHPVERTLDILGLKEFKLIAEAKIE